MKRLWIILLFFLVCVRAQANPEVSLASAFKEAQAAQFNFQDKETIAILSKTLKHSYGDIKDLKYLIDSHLLLALAFKNLGEKADMNGHLAEAARLDPHYAPTELYFPPSLLRQFEKNQDEIFQKNQFGALLIDSKPTGAQIFVNGSFKGSAPLKLNQYPVGEHTITAIVDNRSQSKKIMLEPGLAKIRLNP